MLTIETFINALVEKGLWLRIGGQWNLELRPPSGRRKLSEEEQQFLDTHKVELKQLAATKPNHSLGWKSAPTPPETPIEVFIHGLREKRMWLHITSLQELTLHPKGSYRKLSKDERTFLKENKGQLQTLTYMQPTHTLGWREPDPQPRTQPQSQSQSLGVRAQRERPSAEPEPELYARGVRITERDVEEALEASGELHHYKAGRISKFEAYQRARVRMRQHQEIYGIR